MSRIGKIACLALAYPLFICAQDASTAGTPVQMIVTMGHHYGQTPPALTREDLTVTEVYKPLRISNLIPLRGSGLELFMLVDDCSNCEPGTKFEELRRFIGAQPSSTSIGVGYIHNGQLVVVEKPTQDRARAIKALSAPVGSKPVSPFAALTELINSWTPDSSRHAVVMISNGIDPGQNNEFKDPGVETAIEAAERGRVTIYAIYHPSADYVTGDSSKIYSGQIQLAHLAVESGGEAYFLGFAPLPSLAPFLADIADHLQNQYLLEFLAEGPAGELEDVRVTSKNPDIEIVTPSKVWIPGTPADRKHTGTH